MSSPGRRPQPRRADPPAAAPPATARPAPPAGPKPSFAEAVRERARAKAAAREPAVQRSGAPIAWYRALLIMVAAVTVLWVVEIVNAQDDYGLDRFGLRPRESGGLWGVLTMPFLHANAAHMLSNTFPFVLIGWVVLLSGLRVWALVTATVVLLGGLLTWLVAPSHSVIVGASALVFGWLGYLIARAFYTRRLKWILVAVAVLFFFGTLLFGLFPTLHSNVSWQAHVCGFAAGAAIAFVLHPRRGAPRRPRRPAVS